MVEVLHAWALAPAAIGTCCLAADRRGRTKSAELAASILMTVAMMDAAFLGVVSEVWWATALVAVALAQAVWLRVRSSSNREGSRRGADAMSVHGGIGLIAMAALLVIMCAPAGTTDVGHHAHGSAYATLTLILIGAGYGGASLWLARSGSRLERARILAMGASAVLMTLAAL